MRELLEDLLAELRSNPDVEVQEDYIGPGLSNDEVDELERSEDVRLAPGIRTLYHELNGATIKWRLRAGPTSRSIQYRGRDKEPIYGAVDILSGDELFLPGSDLQGAIWTHAMDSDAQRRLALLRIFDRNVEDARVGVLRENRLIGDELYFVRQGAESIVPIEADIARYLRALRQSRGFHSWQEIFALRPAGLTSSAMYHYIPQLFSDTDFSEFLS